MKNTMYGKFLTGMAITAVGLTFTACNTTKATIDTTVAFFSSTSPQDLFSADGFVKQEQKINLFAGVAYENLRQEAAAGGGQYVTSLATLYQVPVEKHQEFAQLLQRKHADLFLTSLTEDRTAHLKMVDVLNKELTVQASLRP